MLHAYNCNILSFLTSFPHSIGSVDSEPGRQEWPVKKEKNQEIYVLKFWMFFLEGWRLEIPLWRPKRNLLLFLM